MNTLKNWWLAIAGIIVIVLDKGFEVVEPFLTNLGVNSKWVNVVQVIFGIWAVYKLNTKLPTQNVQKLQKLVEEKKEEELIGGRPKDRG